MLEKTHKDLARLKVKMKHFTNCGDWDSVDYYLKDITGVSRKVQEIQRTASWITQEEIQLKYPITSFPEIAEINNFIEPYLRLYTIVYVWRRSMKRWLDGDFYKLNADEIENQTDEMSRYVVRYLILHTVNFFMFQGNVSLAKSVQSKRKTIRSGQCSFPENK